MPVSIKFLACLTLFCATLTGCKKEVEPEYILNPVELYPSSAGKDKIKTNEQYVAILYANLFQTALSPNDIFEVNRVFQSIGDQELAREVLISNFMNNPNVILPSEDLMNDDLEAFIDDTYKRFLVRLPTEAEKEWTKNFIESNEFMNPELVYFSFALSNEYMYY